MKVWPIIVSLPWGLTVGPILPHLPVPSRIRVDVLEPIRFERTGPEAAADDAWVERCHERVLDTMQARLDELAAEARTGRGARQTR